MEKCVVCGREFEPLPLPDLPDLFGIKAPHKAICPSCALIGAAAAAKFAAKVLEQEAKKAESKQQQKGEKKLDKFKVGERVKNA